MIGQAIVKYPIFTHQWHFITFPRSLMLMPLSWLPQRFTHCCNGARAASEERHVHPEKNTHRPPVPNTTCNIDLWDQLLTDTRGPSWVLRSRQVCIIYCGPRKARPHSESVNNCSGQVRGNEEPRKKRREKDSKMGQKPMLLEGKWIGWRASELSQIISRVN